MKPQLNPDQRVDAALRALGTAPPPEGLQGRVLHRLASQRVHMEDAAVRGGWFERLSRRSVPALGFVSAALVCAMIVTGSVTWSRRNSPATVAPPALQMPAPGIGAASAVRPAAPAPSALPAGTRQQGRSSRHAAQGRARVAPHARKAPGVAVPNPGSSLQK